MKAATLVSRNNFASCKRRYIVKLNEKKIPWIIQQKLGGRGTGELALIQRVSRRRVGQLWQAYRRTRVLPALKKPGRPRKATIVLQDATLVLETYDRLKVNALTLERVLRDIHGVKLPHNKIYVILKENGRALPQPSKQRRRKWVRYEREHGMSLWHMDWKQQWDGRWWIAAEDDASRLIVGYGEFQDRTAENTIHVLKQAITKHGRPREVLTDRGSQFYANEAERREKGISQFEQYLALLRRLRAETPPIPKHRRIRPLAQRDQTTPSLNIETLETPIQAFQRKLPPQKTEATQTIQDAK